MTFGVEFSFYDGVKTSYKSLPVSEVGRFKPLGYRVVPTASSEPWEAVRDTQRTLALKEIIEFKVNKVRIAEVSSN